MAINIMSRPGYESQKEVVALVGKTYKNEKKIGLVIYDEGGDVTRAPTRGKKLLKSLSCES